MHLVKIYMKRSSPSKRNAYFGRWYIVCISGEIYFDLTHNTVTFVEAGGVIVHLFKSCSVTRKKLLTIEKKKWKSGVLIHVS